MCSLQTDTHKLSHVHTRTQTHTHARAHTHRVYLSFLDFPLCTLLSAQYLGITTLLDTSASYEFYLIPMYWMYVPFSCGCGGWVVGLRKPNLILMQETRVGLLSQTSTECIFVFMNYRQK